MTEVTTLAVITRNNQILLQKKAAGHFGAGKWNGAGGHVEFLETPTEGLVRELKEELGLDFDLQLAELDRFAILYFYKPQEVIPFIVCHVYRIKQFEGEPRASNEAPIQWFPLDQIPYTEMWADDKLWLPLALNDCTFIAHFHFADSDLKTIGDLRFQVLDNPNKVPIPKIET